MKENAYIDFACNDPDDGSFAGKVWMASYGDIEIEAPKDFAFSEPLYGHFRLHRRVFPFVRKREWIGNWSWDRYYLKRDELKRLLFAMRQHGWRVTSGPDRFFQWWNECGDEATA